MRQREKKNVHVLHVCTLVVHYILSTGVLQSGVVRCSVLQCVVVYFQDIFVLDPHS